MSHVTREDTSHLTSEQAAIKNKYGLLSVRGLMTGGIAAGLNTNTSITQSHVKREQTKDRNEEKDVDVNMKRRSRSASPPRHHHTESRRSRSVSPHRRSSHSRSRSPPRRSSRSPPRLSSRSRSPPRRSSPRRRSSRSPPRRSSPPRHRSRSPRRKSHDDRHRDSHPSSRSSRPPPPSSSSSSSSSSRPAPRAPMSAGERDRLIATMAADAAVLDSASTARVAAAHQRDAMESKTTPLPGKDTKASFINDLNKHLYTGGNETVEERLKKYSHYRQKGSSESQAFL